MLQEKDKRAVKQGWILKKGGSGLLAPWRSKYLMLTTSSSSLILEIYDNLDQGKPKHTLRVSTVKIEPSAKFTMLSRNSVAFIISTSTRKVISY